MELGGMRYIEQEHKLLAHYVKTLQIPELDFKMSGNFLQNYSLKAYLRNDRYRMDEWTDLQKHNQKLINTKSTQFPWPLPQRNSQLRNTYKRKNNKIRIKNIIHQSTKFYVRAIH